MALFRKKKQVEKDPQEQRLDIICDITRGLGRKEFNALIRAVTKIFEARQELLNVKTEDEKEMAPIDEAEKVLEREAKK